MRQAVRFVARPLRTHRAAWLGLGVAAVLLGQAAPAHAQIYVGESTDGPVVLSNHHSDATPVLLLGELATLASSGPGRIGPTTAPPPIEPRATAVPSLPDRYRPIIHSVAREYGLPAALIAAVAAAESAFEAGARSPKGAGGLMQLMPDTARRFKVIDRFSPEQSLRGGAAYLRWLHEKFGSDLHKVLAAYNAGETAVERAGGIPPYAETQAYVPRVLRYLQHFRSVLEPAPV